MIFPGLLGALSFFQVSQEKWESCLRYSKGQLVCTHLAYSDHLIFSSQSGRTGFQLTISHIELVLPNMSCRNVSTLQNDFKTR